MNDGIKTYERDDTVTLVKAVGIILVVVAHVVLSGWVNKLIISFHMPLFFLMSGYCFKEKYMDVPKQFVVRKIKGIYVPYVLYALPFLVLHNVFCHLHIYEPDWLYGWKDFAWHTSRIVTRMSMNEGLLGAFWFLKELFWGSLIFYGMLRVCKKVKKKWMNELTVIGLLILAELMSILGLRIPYFNINHITVFAAFFIAFGYLWKQKQWKLDKWWMWLIGIAVMVGNIWIPYPSFIRDVTSLTLPIYIFPAIIGTMMVFEICHRVNGYSKNRRSAMKYIGNHTLSIMALHFLAFKLVTYGYIIINRLPIEQLESFPVQSECASMWWGMILYTCAGVVLPLLCVYVWNLMSERINMSRNL